MGGYKSPEWQELTQQFEQWFDIAAEFIRSEGMTDLSEYCSMVLRGAMVVRKLETLTSLDTEPVKQVGKFLHHWGDIHKNNRRPGHGNTNRIDTIEWTFERAEDLMWDVASIRESAFLLGTDKSKKTSEKPKPRPAENKPSLRKKATVNERMAAMVMEDKSRTSWNSTKWAAELKCSTSTVTTTETWKSLEFVRRSATSDRVVEDRQRKDRVK